MGIIPKFGRKQKELDIGKEIIGKISNPNTEFTSAPDQEGTKDHKVMSYLTGIYLEDSGKLPDLNIVEMVNASSSNDIKAPVVNGLSKSLVADFIQGLIAKCFTTPPPELEKDSVVEGHLQQPRKKKLQIETL